MNDTDRHWLLERAARVLEPDVFQELESALSRPVSPTSGDQSGEPDSAAVPKRRVARQDVAAPLSEADNREIWGK